MAERLTKCLKYVVLSLVSAASAYPLFGQDVTDAELPKCIDPDIQLQLVAEDPDIVTPIGLAIDGDDSLYVIESHTHLPADDYAGPKSDRIKVLRRTGRESKYRIETFADCLNAAMNLAFSPRGDLFVVCAREVVCFPRVDGRLDQAARRVVLRLETEESYAHNCLLGITFDRQGKLFVARGNTGGRAYTVVGSDGSRVSGYGDGGSVLVCDEHGGSVREFATGFWNPFDLKFDSCGRLLLVDNDPDARGPNRLVHVVRNGDYGYKSLYGGGGNHPFQGWDGSLPGTLPYISGVGEAPSGLIDARRTSLPRQYRNSVLCTIWNENSIEHIDIVPQDGQLSSTRRRRWITGGKSFRPVAIAADSRGDVFFTDWVLVDYPNHGRGKIWRVSTKASAQDRLRPVAEFDGYADDPLQQPKSPSIEQRLQAESAFVRHAAVVELAESGAAASELLTNSDARVRLGALLATELSGALETSDLEGLLADEDVTVRRAALHVAAKTLNPQLRPNLDLAIASGHVDAPLFAAWYAAVQNLQPDFARAVKNRAEDKSKSIKPKTDVTALLSIAEDESKPGSVRALAIEYLKPQLESASGRLLFLALQLDDDEIRESGNTSWLATLLKELQSTELSSELKQSGVRLAERLAKLSAVDGTAKIAALYFIANHGSPDWEQFLGIAAKHNLHANKEPARNEQQRALVAYAVSRLIRRQAMTSPTVQAVARKHVLQISEPADDDKFRSAIGEQLKLASLDASAATQWLAKISPQRDDEWIALSKSSNGNPERGRLVFHSQQLGCARCHSVDGRGALLGPDLSQVAKSKSPEQIAEAIVKPSADFPPQYQAWMVADLDGNVYRGIQLDHKAKGAIEMLTEEGETIRVDGEDVDFYQASPNSLMPEDLHRNLTPTEFVDLLAYLSAMR